jgi:CelD/BcsL family acetyltransferase involved in cellulose biosynthesis
VSSDRTYADPRPFEWNDFAIRPRYTYVVDLSPGPDALLEAFSSDARRNVSDGLGDCEIAVDGRRAIRRTVERVRHRYEQQGRSYTVPPEFVVDLYDRLPDGTVRPYACRRDGEFLGGMVVLAHGDTVYRWQGGAKTDHDLPVNDLLDWRIIRDAVEDGYGRYDLEGANKRRLCEYKAKFAPDVVTYYRMEYGNVWTRLGSRLYTKFVR